MAVTLTDVGIQSLDLALIESFDIEQKTDVKTVEDSDSGFGAAEAVNPTIEFSISGRGDRPTSIALGADNDLDIAAITGGVTIIERVREGQKNDDFQSWEASGKNFPGASS